MRRMLLLVTVAAVMAAFGAVPAMAQSNSSGLYPVGGENIAPAANESAWDMVKDFFSSAGENTAEDIATSALEDAPDAVDAYSELYDMEKGIKKEVLPEYEELIKDAEKTAEEAINDSFFPDFEELFERALDAFSPDDDEGSNTPPNNNPPNNPPPNSSVPPCPPDTGCGG